MPYNSEILSRIYRVILYRVDIRDYLEINAILIILMSEWISAKPRIFSITEISLRKIAEFIDWFMDCIKAKNKIAPKYRNVFYTESNLISENLTIRIDLEIKFLELNFNLRFSWHLKITDICTSRHLIIIWNRLHSDSEKLESKYNLNGGSKWYFSGMII